MQIFQFVFAIIGLELAQIIGLMALAVGLACACAWFIWKWATYDAD